MLIVLLDCSSSMKEPFRREAARQVLRESLASAHPSETVAVFGFAGQVVELARGSSLDEVDLQSRIEDKELERGIDMPAALAVAVSALRRELVHEIRKVILITDGLSDGRPDEDLDPAIQELTDVGASIEVILIGGSHRGLKIALRIAGHGSLTVVMSTGERFTPLVHGGLMGGPGPADLSPGGVLFPLPGSPARERGSGGGQIGGSDLISAGT